MAAGSPCLSGIGRKAVFTSAAKSIMTSLDHRQVPSFDSSTAGTFQICGLYRQRVSPASSSIEVQGREAPRSVYAPRLMRPERTPFTRCGQESAPSPPILDQDPQCH